MSRRAVLATVAVVLLGGSAAPALASTTAEPSQFCVLTSYDQKSGQREGVCVWVPVDPPFRSAASR